MRILESEIYLMLSSFWRTDTRVLIIEKVEVRKGIFLVLRKRSYIVCIRFIARCVNIQLITSQLSNPI